MSFKIFSNNVNNTKFKYLLYSLFNLIENNFKYNLL